MRPPFLLACAQFFNTISTLAFIPPVLVYCLPVKKRLLWPITLVLFPLTIPFLLLWSIAQVVSSICAFTFHQRNGIRASIEADGFRFGATSKRFVSWQEIQLVRRVYERAFGDYQTRFADQPAYQILLESGEGFTLDFVDEALLRTQAEARGVATAGFDSYMPASQFEPLGASSGD